MHKAEKRRCHPTAFMHLSSGVHNNGALVLDSIRPHPVCRLLARYGNEDCSVTTCREGRRTPSGSRLLSGVQLSIQIAECELLSNDRSAECMYVRSVL
jgi:hypothetical protein